MLPQLNHEDCDAIFSIKDSSIFTNLIINDEKYYHPHYLTKNDHLTSDEYTLLQDLLKNNDLTDINEKYTFNDPGSDYVEIKNIQFPKNWYNIKKKKQLFYKYSFTNCKYMFVMKLDTYENLTILINEAMEHGYEIQELNIDNLKLSMFNKKNKNKNKGF